MISNDCHYMYVTSNMLITDYGSNLDVVLFMYRWLYVLERRSNPYEAMNTVVHSPDQENSLNTDEGVTSSFSGSQIGN